MGPIRIEIPPKTISIREEGTMTTTKVRAFVHLIGVVIENTPQRNSTDVTLAHAIREKVDALTEADDHVDLEKAEIDFLKEALTSMHKENKVVGSAWYYFVSPLNDAREVRKTVAAEQDR